MDNKHVRLNWNILSKTYLNHQQEAFHTTFDQRSRIPVVKTCLDRLGQSLIDQNGTALIVTSVGI